MAKRSGAGNLAGLASLAALGYMALKGKGESAPVEDRAAKPAGEYDPIASGDWSYGEQGMMAKEPDRESKVAPPKASAKADVQEDSGTPDRRGLSEAASMARNYKPRRDDPGTLDLRGTSEAQRMDKYYRPRRGRAPEVTREDIEQAKKTADQPFFSEKGLTPYAPYVMAPGQRYKKGGAVKVKKMASGGMTTSSASKRADGIAQKGKTRGKMY
jgi:hypothetical protein